jgi:hypothetical protein
VTEGKKLVSVEGLRKADQDKILVLTSDTLRTPLVRLDPITLCDLLALSELADGLGVALKRDLDLFRAQMIRELEDLPDGPPLRDFAVVLGEVAPGKVPQSLRAAVEAIIPDRKDLEAIDLLKSLLARWEPTPPEDFPPPPKTEKAVKEKRTATKAPKEKAEKKARTPVSQVDASRAEWVRADVLERLQNYGHDGLKEAIVVAGARHRSPWKDLTEKEVLAVLRQMERDGAVRHSAGRWRHK